MRSCDVTVASDAAASSCATKGELCATGRVATTTVAPTRRLRVRSSTSRTTRGPHDESSESNEPLRLSMIGMSLTHGDTSQRHLLGARYSATKVAWRSSLTSSWHRHDAL